MDLARTIMARVSPAISAALVTYGVSSAHADAIALGLVALGATLIEVAYKHWGKR